jgi:hypothetical protein
MWWLYNFGEDYTVIFFRAYPSSSRWSLLYLHNPFYRTSSSRGYRRLLPYVVYGSDGSLGAAESAGPYHTKLRILFSYFLIKKCLRYFSSNPNNNLNYNFHFCLVPNYIVLCTVCFVNTHISTYKYLNASRIVLIKKKCV